MPRAKKAVEAPGEDLTFSLESDLWTPDHVRRCREKYPGPGVTMESFMGMMRRAKKLDRDPMTDIWMANDGNFLMHAHAMFEYANRTERYAPGAQPAVFEYTEDKGPTNPFGLHRCIVSIKVKQGDTWHDCPGEAFWNDLVPLVNTRFDQNQGLYVGGVVSNATGWASMPHTLLKKCAFVDALKRAFPELAAFYVREEREQTTAIEQQRPSPVAQNDTADPTGGQREAKQYFIPVNWLDNDSEMVPDTEFFERTTAFLTGEIESGAPQRVVEWFKLNVSAMDDFWARDQHLTKRRNAVVLKKLLPQAQQALDEAENARSQPEAGQPSATLAAPRRGRLSAGVSV
jgi:hypothetical protein